MYVYIWQYRVRPEAVDQFLEHYAPHGVWARLFASSAGYEGTTLLRDVSDACQFVTIDTWATEAHHTAFLAERGSEFEALDTVCEGFTEWEREIGTYLSESADR